MSWQLPVEKKPDRRNVVRAEWHRFYASRGDDAYCRGCGELASHPDHRPDQKVTLSSEVVPTTWISQLIFRVLITDGWAAGDPPDEGWRGWLWQKAKTRTIATQLVDRDYHQLRLLAVQLKEEARLYRDMLPRPTTVLEIGFSRRLSEAIRRLDEELGLR